MKCFNMNLVATLVNCKEYRAGEGFIPYLQVYERSKIGLKLLAPLPPRLAKLFRIGLKKLPVPWWRRRRSWLGRAAALQPPCWRTPPAGWGRRAAGTR